MRMYDLITKKKHGEALTNEEIKFMVDGYVKGEIPDYQMSSMLMAIWFKGMNDEEITELTMNMAKSGDMIDLSAIEGLKVDKHSTGGVGDKTTLIVGPIVAACGGKVAKMSGRGLGHTGGTVDKLEAIPGTPPNMIYPPKGDAFADRNKYALEIDFEEEPPMFSITETHKAATWLLHPNAPKIEKPKIITDRINRMREREAANNGR